MVYLSGKINRFNLTSTGWLITLLFVGWQIFGRAAVPVEAAPPPNFAASTFEAAECPIDIPAETTVECGYLTVPEEHHRPEGKTVRLAVAIIKSETANPAADPVVYLEGGPGGGAISVLEQWVEMRFDEGRDFILIDQRGTGFSEPNLSCPELDELDTPDNPYAAENLSDAEELDLLIEGATACRTRLVEEGVNLAAYNSAENAADLEALRLALGYDQWNLYGISYGTRLALTAMRDYPAGIRSVILDSVYPPEVGFYTEQTANTDRVFNLLFHSCAAQADCAAAYPNLEELFYGLVERANDQPLELTILDFFSGEPYQIRVDGDDIVNTLFQAFYESTFIPYLPLTIYEAEQGRFDLLGVLIDVLSFESDFSTGMYYSVQCREEVPFNAAEAVALSLEPFPRLARFVDYESTLAVCGLWAAGQAANLETEPVTSDIPTLVLSGQFDPITPPGWGQSAIRTLQAYYFYEFPGLGHGVTVADTCPEGIAADFTDQPTVEPDAGCIAAMTGPDYVTDLYPTSLFYDLTAIFFNEPNYSLLAILGLCLLLCLSAFTIWPLGLVIHRLRQGGAAHSPGGYLIALIPALTGLLSLGFVVALGVIFISVAIEYELTYIFGGPAWIQPILLLPFVIAGLAVVLVGLLGPVWRKRYWFLLWRAYYTVFTGSMLVLVGLFWVWRLFRF